MCVRELFPLLIITATTMSARLVTTFRTSTDAVAAVAGAVTCCRNCHSRWCFLYTLWLVVMTQVLLIEHDIPTREFSAAVMACLPSPKYSCAPVPGSGRVDLRHLDVCSIDPPGCKVVTVPSTLALLTRTRTSAPSLTRTLAHIRSCAQAHAHTTHMHAC